MVTSVSVRRASKVLSWVGRAGLVVVLASTAACGGSAGNGSDSTAGGSTAGGAASSAAATESSTPSEVATPTPAPAAGGSLGKEICDVIKRVQADVITGSPSAAYQAQLTIGLSGMVGDQAKVEDFQTNGDAEAKKTCPTEYAAFLTQAGITTLASL